MRLYFVYGRKSGPLPEGVNHDAIRAWAGTQADANRVKADAVSHNGFKRKDITVRTIEVPTDKAGLLNFLSHSNAIPPAESDEG